MGSWKIEAETNAKSNLPLDAFVPFREHDAIEINDFWLANADDDSKLDALRAWFRARFCDPAIRTPYNGREGGYQFINGGPYDPGEVIPSRFRTLVHPDLIQIVIDEMHSEHHDRWAPVQYDRPDDYDDLFGLPDFRREEEPAFKLSERLANAKSILTLSGDASAKRLVERLAFGAAISALEAFLWETVSYWVEHDRQVVQRLITGLPRFRDEPIKLGQIYDRHETLKGDILSYLQNIVWHRWDQVIPLFTIGLEIELDSTRVFQDAMVKRHDIVHRSGHDKGGNPISIDSNEVVVLCEKIEFFATTIKDRISRKLSEF